ncbi:VPS10, VPS10 domain protein [Paenibacillus alkaliterrae]|uniref:F510_1955 family glycosylhydrolase n=1 Tax=Paenibacillus alkaliterrae TaxID=320909 RepID=UPI001F42C4EF|nr:VPS10, VPS10 domain protein [Paenibacillus alkaliterrae]MCF2941451.1 VPS10, VPS10 domain protein [Paenibacillus alkaliterrae]
MKSKSKKNVWIWGIFGLVILAALIMILNQPKSKSVSLTHIHGLGFTNDGSQLLIPAHDGLVSYTNNRWQAVNGEKHDYMGFNLVDNGFYSSGHPERGSDLKNPLGIVKSTDNGKTLEFMDFYGIEDFHFMAVGYNSHAIYLFNPQANARLSAAGLYVSLDQTKTWKMSSLNGLTGDLISLAAHPTDTSTIAIGTSEGVYLSSDFGDQFDKLPIEQEVTAVAFGNNGDLFVGGKGILFRNKAGVITPLSVLPLSPDDAIMYLAQNPTRENELAIATSTMNVFISKDNGLSWSQIAKEGAGLSIESE